MTISTNLTAQQQACGNLNWSALSSTGFCLSHLLVIFEKSLVAIEVQNFCVKSPIIAVEFEIKRSSKTTSLAVARASMPSDRSRSDEMENAMKKFLLATVGL